MKMYKVFQDGKPCSEYQIPGFERDVFHSLEEANIFAYDWVLGGMYPDKEILLERASKFPLQLGVGMDLSFCEIPIVMEIRVVEDPEELLELILEARNQDVAQNAWNSLRNEAVHFMLFRIAKECYYKEIAQEAFNTLILKCHNSYIYDLAMDAGRKYFAEEAWDLLKISEVSNESLIQFLIRGKWLTIAKSAWEVLKSRNLDNSQLHDIVKYTRFQHVCDEANVLLKYKL